MGRFPPAHRFRHRQRPGPLAEAWVLSCHPDGPSYIVGGPDDGKTLAQYIEEKGKDILGENCKKFADSPS